MSTVHVALWRDGDHEYHGQGESEEAAWQEVWEEVGGDVEDLIENGSFPEMAAKSIKDKIRWWWKDDANSIFVTIDGKEQELSDPFYDQFDAQAEDPFRVRFAEAFDLPLPSPSTLYLGFNESGEFDISSVPSALKFHLFTFEWNGNQKKWVKKMSAETTFHNDRGDIVFEASGENRYQMFKQVKRDHLDEINEAFDEFGIEETGDYEKDVRAWWAEAHPTGWIDTVTETEPPPSTLFVVKAPSDNWTNHVFTDLKQAVDKFNTTGFQSKRFVWNGSEWEAK